MNKEFAIGAASLSDHFINEGEYASEDYIKEELQVVRKRLQEMHQKFKGTTPNAKLTGATVILVDDGIATGNTMLAAIRLIKKSKPEKIVVAVPVSSNSAYELLSKEADEVIAMLIPYNFHGVGQFYESFETVSDEEVKEYLDKITNHIKQ